MPTFSYVTTGGLSIGGDAGTVLRVRRLPGHTCCPLDDLSSIGGVRAGGSATVDIVNDLYDGFGFVLPLDEEADGTPDEYKDRSRNQLHGTGGNGSDPEQVPIRDLGMFCLPSIHTDGRSYVTIPADRLDEDQSFGVSLWTKIETFYQGRVWYSRGHVTAEGDRCTFSLGHNFLNQLEVRIEVVTSDGRLIEYTATGRTTIEQNVWHHVAADWRPGEGVTIYLDGYEDGSAAISETLVSMLTNSGYVARRNDASMPTGNEQEVRLHGEARGAAYYRAEADNWCGTFFVVGSEEDTTVWIVSP